jgi:putative SOS response-associated peptidase YedK
MFGTQGLSWREVAQLTRLSTQKPLPPFADRDHAPLRRRAKAVADRNRSPIIREQHGIREATEAVWGLLPAWWSKPLAAKTFDTFNAKIEQVREEKSYWHALRHQRCLVPAACFYVSTGHTGARVRHRCSLAAGGPVLLMGLWDYNWTHELLTFTILTTEPGPRFRRFHNRVPAIAPTADAVDAFLVGDVDRALDLASRSNDDLIAIDPPEPA